MSVAWRMTVDFPQRKVLELADSSTIGAQVLMDAALLYDSKRTQ